MRMRVPRLDRWMALVVMSGVCVATLGEAASAAEEPFRFPRPMFPVSSSAPEDFAVADFDADGWLDAAVAARTENSVIVMMGSEAGVLTETGSIPVGDQPRGILATDLSGDGVPDIAVTNSDSDTVSILIGVGDGTFGAPVSHSVGVGPRRIETGHFDLDGIPDLVVADYEGGTLSFLMGTGNGAFTVGGSIAVGVEPVDLTVGHFNGDALDDIALVRQDGSGTVVLIGLGGGSFAPPVVYAGARMLSVVSADFDGDEILDLVTANDFGGPVFVQIRYGIGDGTFSGPIGVAFGGAIDLAAADLDADGDQDLLIGASGITFHRNDGGGPFTPVGSVLSTIGVNGFVVEDFDGDGTLDVMGGSTLADGLVLLRGNGSFAFDAGPVLDVGDRFVELVDLDDDGLLDIVSIDDDGFLGVAMGQGQGLFGPVASQDLGIGSALRLLVADLDADDQEDLVVLTRPFTLYRANVFPGLGDGTFGSVVATDLGTAQFNDWTLGHLDDDGVPDLVTTYWVDERIGLHLGLGDGTFSEPAVFHPTGFTPGGAVIVDFDGDLMNDIVVADRDNNVLATWTNTGSGFVAGRSLATVINPGSLELADVNGDGRSDIVGTGTGEIFVHLQDAAGIFQPVQASETHLAGVTLPFRLADMDRDGHLDGLLSKSGVLEVSQGDGAGDFTPIEHHAMGAAFAAGDIDGDGAPDVLAGNEIFINKTGGPWCDLGFALGGTHGEPRLESTGTLDGGDFVELRLRNALENTPAFLFFGIERLDYTPFFGGTLVPNGVTPPGGFAIVFTDGNGELDLGAPWPNVFPPGFETFYQYWIADPGAPYGYSASNALQAVTPLVPFGT